MNIVDSSCWLEYLMDTEIGVNVAPVVENPGELIVPTITLYEVYKKLLAEKGEEYALDVAAYMQTGTVVELNAGLSLSAAQISRKHKLQWRTVLFTQLRCTIQRYFFPATSISKIYPILVISLKHNKLRRQNYDMVRYQRRIPCVAPIFSPFC